MSATTVPFAGYRYTLRRDAAPMTGLGRACWIMLNPSTADDHTDDPTIRRVTRFTADNGLADLIVVNLFAARSTNPADLAKLDRAGIDVVGPGNAGIIENAIGESSIVIAAWGASCPRPIAAIVRSAAHHVADRCEADDVPLASLGVTATGQPRHPLYVPASTPLELWRPR